jgi:hypothetical protein
MKSRAAELLRYDPDTGVLTWKSAVSPQRAAGSVAGTRRPDGYSRIKLDGRLYLAHRLAWLLTHGTCPKEIDHISGDRSDNRIANLRAASRSQNSQNRSGVKGVTLHRGKWEARIVVNGKRIHILSTPSKAEAEDWYKAFADLAFGAHAYHNRPGLTR